MFGSLVSSALSAVKPFTGLLGDAATAYGSYREADRNREFQEEMSNTSYQRAVKDLNAAGLSPMLAYSKGGASTPSGSVADPVRFGETGQRTSASDLSKAQVDVAKSQEQVNIQSAKQIAEQAKKTAIEVEQMPTRFYYDLANIGSQINANSAGAIRTTVQARNDERLQAPGADYPWYRDLKSTAKGIFDAFKQKNPSFPWGLKGKRNE
jgi:hypothetical protein